MDHTIVCTWEEFKQYAKQFNDAAATLDEEQLENAFKCLGLAYLGMSEPMWEHSAAAVLNIASRTYNQRLVALHQQQSKR